MDTSETPRPEHSLARLSPINSMVRGPLALPPARPAVPASSTGLNPRMVLRGLMRHWWQALALWVVGTVGLAALVYTKYKPEYESFSILRAEPPKQNLFDILQKTDNNYIATQVQMILSPRVLSEALQKPELQGLEILRDAPDAETELRSMMNVKAIPGTYLIRVAATTPSAPVSATLVNAVVDSFKEAEGDLADLSIREQMEPLEEYQRRLKVELEEKQKEWKDLASQLEAPPEWVLSQLRSMQSGGGTEGEQGKGQTSGQGSQPMQLSVELQQYEMLQSKMMEQELELVEAKALLQLRKAEMERGDSVRWSESEVQRLFLEDPEVRQVVAQIRQIEQNMATMQTRIKKSSDPALIGLMRQKSQLALAYSELWEAKKERIRQTVAQAGQTPDGAVEEAERAVQRLTVSLNATKQMIANLKIENRKKSEKSIEIAILQNDLNRKRAMLEAVERRVEQLNFDRRSTDKVVEVNPARPIYVPINNKRNKYLAAVPVAMLGVVLGLFTLLEMRSGRVGSPDELSSRVPVEVFSVPPLPVVRPARGLKDARNNETQFEVFVQQLDHLRVALCGEAAQHPGRGRCVLITSATGGEGKTTLAAQLAVRCAEAGASTVLIDADLRRATLGKLFEVPECPGLSDVLRGEANLEDALVPISQVGGCQLLPAGSPEPNPNRVLRGQRFAPMLEQLRRTFDVIIIDTSPVLPVPDALIMGRYTDGVVLAARHDRSRFPLVERANTLLTGAGIPVLGVVINGVRTTATRYGQYAYSYRSDRTSGGGAVGQAG